MGKEGLVERHSELNFQRTLLFQLGKDANAFPVQVSEIPHDMAGCWCTALLRQLVEPGTDFPAVAENEGREHCLGQMGEQGRPRGFVFEDEMRIARLSRRRLKCQHERVGLGCNREALTGDI